MNLLRTRNTPASKWKRSACALLTLVLLATACGTDDNTSTIDPSASEPTISAEEISPERCALNRAVGTITFVTSFDYSASANILGPIVADAEGFFDQVCLDVEIQPGFAPGNAALVESGVADFGSAGSLGDVMNTNIAGDANLVAVAQYGNTAIEALVVPADSSINELSDLSGATIGIKGDIPYSIQLMLASEGVERSSLTELLLDGFDPVVHLALGVDALPVYKSNEPRQLEAAGVQVRTFDPLDYDIPSSFGIQFTSREFLEQNPTAVQDFIRASFRGFQFAVDSPTRSVQHTIDLVQAAEGALTTEGEEFRWAQESAIVLASTPPGRPIGLIDTTAARTEAEALTAAGIFDEMPDYESMIDPSVANGVWNGLELIWPESNPAGN